MIGMDGGRGRVRSMGTVKRLGSHKNVDKCTSSMDY